MAGDSLNFIFPVETSIPVDLFITKERKRRLVACTGGGDSDRSELKFSDPSGNLVFEVVGEDHRSSSKSSANRLLANLIDKNGNLLISISRNQDGWQGHRAINGEGRELMFKMARMNNELKVFVSDPNSKNSEPYFVIRGSPCARSCTIYQGNSIIAQTSLMYKLRTIFVGKRRFRLTIFPGLYDHALVAALVVTFFHGHI